MKIRQLVLPILYLCSTGVKSYTASGMRLRLRPTRIGSRNSGKERDAETGLDYFGARYYTATHPAKLEAKPTEETEQKPNKIFL